MTIHPIELKDANAFIKKFHRHHKPTVGHRFSLSVWEADKLIGVAICGRPVARKLDKLKVLEVTRLCTDGTPNACSILYAAAMRAAKAIGFERIQTYILETEPGTSLKAVGWTPTGKTAGGEGWHSREGRRFDQPTCPKVRWERQLQNEPYRDQSLGKEMGSGA